MPLSVISASQGSFVPSIPTLSSQQPPEAHLTVHMMYLGSPFLRSSLPPHPRDSFPHPMVVILVPGLQPEPHYHKPNASGQMYFM